MMISTKQREILRHALGLTRGKVEYRNHFVTGKGSTDYADCEFLVASDLMTKFADPTNWLGGDECYVVTAVGKLAARDIC